MLHKILRYSKELVFCFKAGRRLGDSLRLCQALLAFHWANSRRKPIPGAETPSLYRLTLEGQPLDLYLRTRSGDLFVFLEIFYDGCYKLPHQILSQADGPPMRILDLGANIGLATLYFSCIFPDAQFWCVEPDPGNLEILKANVSDLGLGRVRILEGAVGGSSGVVMIEATKPAWGRQVVDSAEVGGTVRCWSMEELFREPGLERVELVKMDVEGAETEILGRSEWLNSVNSIVAELHDDEAVEAFVRATSESGLKIIGPSPGAAPQLCFAARSNRNHS